MATNNGIPDATPPDKRPRGGYSAPPPDESPRQDATADPKKEYVASSGYGAGLRDYLRALPVYVDDLTREVDLHVYERMRWDECVAGSLDALVYQALADDIDFRPAVDDEDSQYYDDSKAQADTINRVMADLDRPLIEWAYEMVSDAIGGGNRVSEKVVRQEEGGPYSGLWVWDRLKVKPRRHLSFAMDTFNNLRGILTAIPGTYMGLDGSIPVDPKETPNLLPRSKFALLSWNSHNDDPRGRPLLRRVYVPWWEKIQTAGEWLKHLSRFGSPSLVGTTAPNSDFVPSQDEFGNPLAGTAPGPEQALLNGLERLQNGGCLVLPYGATVTALQVAQSGSAFLTKVDQCDRAISRGVLLAIRAVMEAQHGSKADSQTAQDVTGLVVRYVKNWAARMITRDLVKPLVVWNKGADAARVICPYASLTPVEHQDWSQKATAVAALKTSGFLKPSQEPALAEEMGLPPATEPVEQPQPQPQSQPGQQPGQNGVQGQTADTAQTANGAEVASAPSAATFAEADPFDFGDISLGGLSREEIAEILIDAALDARDDAEFAWDESKHPRGQPGNRGKFGPGGGAENPHESRDFAIDVHGELTERPNTPIFQHPVRKAIEDRIVHLLQAGKSRSKGEVSLTFRPVYGMTSVHQGDGIVAAVYYFPADGKVLVSQPLVGGRKQARFDEHTPPAELEYKLRKVLGLKVPPEVERQYAHINKAPRLADPDPEAAFDNAEFYDSNQLRDDRGRWTVGGGSGTSQGLPHAERQAQRESAKETVRSFMAGKGSPSLQEASGLAQALSTLTVAQLHEVKKEHGLKASSPDKAGLVAKLAERFRAARESKPAEKKPSETDAEQERQKRIAEGRITAPGKWAAGINPREMARGFGLPEDFYVDARTRESGTGGFPVLSGEVHINEKYDPDGKVAAAVAARDRTAQQGSLTGSRRRFHEEAVRAALAEAVARAKLSQSATTASPSDLRREAIKSAIGDTYSPYNGTHQLLQDIAGKHDTLAGALSEAERQGLIDTRQRSPQADVSPLQTDRQGEWVRRVLGQVYGEKETDH